MTWVDLILSAIPAAAAVGAGLWKVGHGMIAVSRAMRLLVVLAEDHEKRLSALEKTSKSRSGHAQRPPAA
jgi:hypothetical protein